MADVTEFSIFGYAITPWFIVFCSCVAGAIILAITVISGFSGREAKERRLIENAAKNTSGIPVKNIEIPTMDFGADGQDATESIAGNDTAAIYSSATEGFSTGTEAFAAGETEGLNAGTGMTEMKTEGLNMKTEGFAADSVPKTFACGETEAFAAGRTEEFEPDNNKSKAEKAGAKFCSRCGNKVKGNFCSHCGHKIN